VSDTECVVILTRTMGKHLCTALSGWLQSGQILEGKTRRFWD